MSELDRILTEHIRAQIRAVDESAELHWLATGHQMALVMDLDAGSGWRCQECSAPFIIQPARWPR